jgi:6-phosphogluconolactonase (cycloisomerase 2 family)
MVSNLGDSEFEGKPRFMRVLVQWLTATVCCVVCAPAGCTGNGLVSAGIPAAPIAPTPVILAPIATTATAKFAYTGNQGASLSGYSVNTSTGALTALNGFPVSIGANPTVVAVDPQNRFLFVGDIALSELHVFAINSSTGALSEVGASPYGTVKEPVAIAVDPAGTHVYVTGQGSHSVGGFTVSGAGDLTPIAGSPFATSGNRDYEDDVVVNAAGTFVYAQDLDNIYTYSVNASSGAVTLIQTVPSPLSVGGIALDPHGTYLYAVGSGANSIVAYSVDASTGLLMLAGTSPLFYQDGAYTISISPTGQFAYTIEKNNYLVSYVLSDGVFTHIGTVYSQVYGQRIGIDPSGSFVYVPLACGNCPGGVYNVVNAFSIGSTGALTRFPGVPVAAGTTPWGIAITSQ